MSNSSKDKAGNCVKCGTCNTVCPVYLATGNEIYTPRGKQHLEKSMASGKHSVHFAEIFSKCLLCGACFEACPRGLDTPGKVLRVRSELSQISGLSFLKYLSRKALVNPSLLSGLGRLGSAANTLLGDWLPVDSGLRLRLQGLEYDFSRLPRQSYLERQQAEPDDDRTSHERKLNFFTGCLANYLQPEIAEATQLLATKATGSKAAVPQEQTCCGMAALAAGRPEEARDLARKNIMAFEGNDHPVLASCSSCYFQLKTYDELFADDPEWLERAKRFTQRLREFSTFFLEQFSGRTELFALQDAAHAEKILYHDPCHLRFKLHIIREPRQLISLLPGVALVELPDGPKCCGQGGLFQVAHPDLARDVWQRLESDLDGLPVQKVVTACSGCLLQWQKGLTGENHITAQHLALFIAGLLR